MLTTIIYRSHLADEVPVSILPGMVETATQLNARHQVTGILLFNGTHFFQILEGSEEDELEIYGRICAEHRHHNVVDLMRDYSPSRRFGNHVTVWSCSICASMTEAACGSRYLAAARRNIA